ncbi:MAG: hypothetical protein HUU21_09310 [Polyangiaceae bacterium]|nr:hypothetical protein [Polyangiaceae bacterium]
MIKVIVRRAKGAVSAASTLLVAAGGAGCVAEPVDEPMTEPVAESEDELSAGSAVLVLGFQYAPPIEFVLDVTQSTTDEFIRATESLQIELPAWMLWQELYPQDPVPNDANRLKQLTGSVKVHLFDKAQKVGVLTLPIVSFTGAMASEVVARTGSFNVPSKIDALSFELILGDDANPGVMGSIPGTAIRTLPVFGGELPNKTLFFDTSGARRQRIIEGNNLVAGANFLVSYSDWRADMIANKASIDTQIGVAEVASRFGFIQTPIYGKIIHEVSYGIYFNDFIGWRPEATLTANPSSRLLPLGRTAFEATLKAPAKATKMSIYVHVKTFLVADYTPYSNITQKWYQDNEKLLKNDQYDNPFGAFTNYDYTLQN